MAPSKESEALSDLFKIIASKFPRDGDPFLSRAVYDNVHKAAAECPGVTYGDEDDVAGRPALWVRPMGATPNKVMLFMHGGGYSFGSPNSHRKLTAHLAKACNVNALSIDYRMTPEHPYPAPLDDCVNAYKWLLDKGYAADSIVLAGDSCGGGLVSAVPLEARKHGLPLPGASVAMSPWYDLTLGSDSLARNKEKDVLGTKEFVNMLADLYTNGNQELRKDPVLSPLFGDLQGLNPHWISVAGHDTLLDDGIRFAEKAKKAGVEVHLVEAEGQQHVFEFLAGKAPEADESIKNIGEWVKQKIGS
ncbi:hypothetical protein CKM354_001008000 [Cercospora kikuchii]|uniref:Alpha/beta hydrolase fold-3 domain-containing protein n=1 Tax=Cercospora kikuchii TaxID=84275 RepID=A0A9P3CYJ9_9PEZI|nr:uncharacterized protein CKM354_001008000 [Cercospora kikuchii]GIZ46978.1 hypothetical protein CKM354_001008000 [Cercospora kikuchii]